MIVLLLLFEAGFIGDIFVFFVRMWDGVSIGYVLGVSGLDFRVLVVFWGRSAESFIFVVFATFFLR